MRVRGVASLVTLVIQWVVGGKLVGWLIRMAHPKDVQLCVFVFKHKYLLIYTNKQLADKKMLFLMLFLIDMMIITYYIYRDFLQ